MSTDSNLLTNYNRYATLVLLMKIRYLYNSDPTHCCYRTLYAAHATKGHVCLRKESTFVGSGGGYQIGRPDESIYLTVTLTYLIEDP